MQVKDQQNFFDPFATGTKLSTLTYPSPYPYFGGKALIAREIWDRFGNVKNYVEPFFGGGSVLLKRPNPQGYETVNDLDCYIANFWRAIKHDLEGVKYHALYPIIEIDIHSRNLWLINNRKNYQDLLMEDPVFFDSKVAGWWVHGQINWLGRAYANKPYKQIPKLSHRAGFLAKQESDIEAYLTQLSARLKNVRVLCGDWKRIIAPSITENIGVTGIFLDPPYSSDLCDQGVYAMKSNISEEVRIWAISKGNNLNLRIAIAGYKEEHDQFIPANWERVHWKANGGFGNQAEGRGKKNKEKETLWFSPGCLKARQASLFDEF